ncbi:MFS transporter [Pseudoduganella chitinolytica]|uniref:MFS transporter n=1 Tax=Pseudoduganella chitinolytica TaxID=34070 RepID=A0ABY8BCS7_9BURK|nr:MFS transporter [Pseudoduganella chitinolytica]WEF33707.1 MFS transporter [Pseudoduganella chitinolytica]
MSVPAELSDRARARGLNALLVYTFLMVSGFAMLMPLVTVHFVSNAGLAAAAVGGALALRQVTQQGLALAGGMLADRFGVRPMICLGVLLRAAGFASLAFAREPVGLCAAMALAALGGALFEAPYQAAIAALTTEQTRPRYYALSNWVSGIASTAGPLIGVALLRFDFQAVCLAAAGCFALNCVIALLLLPPLRAEAPQPAARRLGLVARDRPFLLLTLLMMGYWFVAVQINISFPLLAERLGGNQDSVGIMFALSAALTVLLQYHLLRWAERWLASRQILVLGVTILALGVGAVALAGSFGALLACVAAFSLGAILVRPTLQNLIASMADRQALGTFLGFSSLSLALGGAAGNVAGGWLFESAGAARLPQLPWLLFCAVGLATAFGLARLVPAREAA